MTKRIVELLEDELKRDLTYYEMKLINVANEDCSENIIGSLYQRNLNKNHEDAYIYTFSYDYFDGKVLDFY